MSTDEPTPPPAPDYGSTPPTPPPGGGYGAPPPSGGYGAPPVGGSGYSVGDALSYGWQKFGQNVGVSLLVTLLVLVVGVILSGLGTLATGGFSSDNGSFSFNSSGLVGNAVSSALVSLAMALVGAILIRGALDVTEGRSLDFGSITGRIPWGNVAITALLVAVITGIGTLLCFLPGLIATLLLYFAQYFVVDKGLAPVEALTASFNLVRNNLGSALVWAIVAFIVTAVGLCLCGVGLLATIPIGIFGTAYTYKKLTGQAVAA